MTGRTRNSNPYNGAVVVVTGGAAGMGRSLAVEATRRGARVAICDVDLEGLDGTAELCRKAGADAFVHRVDMTERDAVRTFAEGVVDRYGRVDFLFNNAGIAFTGTFHASGYKDIERVMDVDFWGVVNGTKEFLPHLIASGDGHLVNTSSVFGLFAFPGFNAYNAAKFAVRGFTEAIRMEMQVARHPVAVSCVHPGGVKTAIARNSTATDGVEMYELVRLFDRITYTSADDAARTILDGAAKGRPKILVGPDAHVLNAITRVLGSAYQPLATAAARLTLPKQVRSA